jgi:hypothetical protein
MTRPVLETDIAVMLRALAGETFGECGRSHALRFDAMPPDDVKVIPVRLLRKLHADLSTFIAQARAAEDAALLREANRAP